MGTALRVTSAILFFVGVHLIVPRVTTAAGNLNNATSQNSTKFERALENSTTIAVNLTDSQANKLKLDSNNGYEPPNYGSPDSEHGSGTR
jgi:hypothetical protein